MEIIGFGTPYWFSRVGGKQYLKKKITAVLPRDGVTKFVEPFVGSGKVILSMDDYPKEVVNDMDKDVYWLWKGMKTVKPASIEKMDLTPSKEKFNSLRDSKGRSLYKSIYLSLNGFRSRMNKYGGIANVVEYKRKLLEKLPDIQERLKKMTILNQDWKKVVKSHDSPGTLFYLDPPYYEVEGYGDLPPVTPEDLQAVLSKVKGKWALSYNDVPIIRKLFSGYKIRSMTTRHSAQAGGVKTVKEVLITNF